MARKPLARYALAMRRLAKWLCGMVVAAGMPVAAQVVVISGQVNYQGTSVPFAPIQVCAVTSTGTPCLPTAAIYSNYNLTGTPLTNPTSADQNGNYTLYAASLSAPAFYVVQVTPVPGTVWSYVVAAGLGSIAPLIPISEGGTGATTVPAADGNLGVPGPVCNVVLYGASGNCTGSGSTSSCMDNHNAIQAAVNACYANGGSVYFPTNPTASGQTVYYTATAVNPKGVPMFASPGAAGPGADGPPTAAVAVRGAPGQDVFDVPAYGSSGWVQPLLSPTVTNLAVIFDDSVNASASFPNRKPGRTFKDGVANGTTVVTSANQAQFQPGDVGQAITVGSTTTTVASWQSATQVTLSTTVTTGTGLTGYISVMGLPVTQTIGNCGYAYDDPAGAYTGGTPLRALFSESVFEVLGSSSNGNYTCGFFFQGNQAPYQTRWQHNFVGGTFPFAFVPVSTAAPTTGQWQGLADFDVFDNNWISGPYPFIEYSGSFGDMSKGQISDAFYGPHFLNAYGISTYSHQWQIEIPEFEVNSAFCTGNPVGFRVAGQSMNVTKLGMVLCPSNVSVFQWDANESEAHRVGLSGVGNFNISGYLNHFDAPYNADTIFNSSTTFNITGKGNDFSTGGSSNPFLGTEPGRQQMAGGNSASAGPADLSRFHPAFDRTHDFLDGQASTPFYNAEDLWMCPQELGSLSSLNPVKDNNSECQWNFSIPGGSTYSLLSTNGTAWTIGSQFPATKQRFYVKAKLATGGTLTINIIATESGTPTLVAQCTPTATTSYAVYSCDADLTGLTGDLFSIQLGGNVYAGNVAWVGDKPYDSDPFGAYGGSSGSCPFITDAPYNAACNGSTDDSAAIQAAMNANGCIQLPLTTPADLQQCNIHTGLVENNSILRIYGNQSILEYTGTGYAISGNSGFVSFLGVYDLISELSSGSGNPSEIDVSYIYTVDLNDFIDSGVGPSGYYALSSVHNAPAFLNVSNSNIPGPVALSSNQAGEITASNVDPFGNPTTLNAKGIVLSNVGNVNCGDLDLTTSVDVTLQSTCFNALNLGSVTRIGGNAVYSTLTGSPTSGMLCTSAGDSQYVCTTYGTAVGSPPTSCSGLPTGTLYNNSGTAAFCP